MALAPDIWEPDKFKEIVSVLEGHDKTFANQFGEFNNNDRNPLQVASAFYTGNFNAIMQCIENTKWTFGTVVCSNHLLRGWDSAHSLQFQEGHAHLVEENQEEVSAVEVAVLAGNAQFFKAPLNKLLLKGKWNLFVRHEFMHRAVYFFVFVLISTASACMHDGFRVAFFLRLWSFFLAVFMLSYFGATFVRVRRTYFFRSYDSHITKAFMLDLHKAFACIGVLISIFIQTYLDFQPFGSEHHRALTGFLYGCIMPLALMIAWICSFELLLLNEYLSNVLLVIIEIFKWELPVWLFLQVLLISAFTSTIYIATAKVYNEDHVATSVFGSYGETVVSLALVPLGGIAGTGELMASEHDVVVCLLYFTYAALSCVLFLNLTISLFTERTRYIWENKDQYYYEVVALLCIAEEKRRKPAELRKFWIGSKLGDGKHYLLVQKFKKQDEQEFD